MMSSKRLTSVPWVQTAIGVTAAEYLRLVWNTTRFALEPADIYGRAERYVQPLPSDLFEPFS